MRDGLRGGGRWFWCGDAEDAVEKRFAGESVRDMRAAVCLAQEVGAVLGGSAFLLGRLSGDGEAKGIGMSGEQRIFERAVGIARGAE